MLSSGVRVKSSFFHSLVNTEPAAASQDKLKEFPSINGFVFDVIEAPDILSVGQQMCEKYENRNKSNCYCELTEEIHLKELARRQHNYRTLNPV